MGASENPHRIEVRPRSRHLAGGVAAIITVRPAFVDPNSRGEVGGQAPKVRRITKLGEHVKSGDGCSFSLHLPDILIEVPGHRRPLVDSLGPPTTFRAWREVGARHPK